MFSLVQVHILNILAPFPPDDFNFHIHHFPILYSRRIRRTLFSHSHTHTHIYIFYFTHTYAHTYFHTRFGICVYVCVYLCAQFIHTHLIFCLIALFHFHIHVYSLTFLFHIRSINTLQEKLKLTLKYFGNNVHVM